MADSLAHSSDSNASALGLNGSKPFRGHSLALVFHGDADGVFFAIHPNQRRLASGVTMNVGEAFLHQAEYDEFHLGGEPSEIVRNLQINLQTAALRQALHIPTQCRR